MSNNIAVEKIESVLRKIHWAQEILSVVQSNPNEQNIADIISGVSFIMDSASQDAEALYQIVC